ncbi:NUDIX hydrolase [Dactylosporangium sp. AC04546]|uniref:NUDIX domain-containing protein n=1 Tax=Dactylosporangium sp. AC04546 TaxID=2862460 RepID=UPI001EE0ABF1|nr:NUDIX hydrolase [Dactylosporangium sp. AC04546]WVK83561.1 NUDIX hydrolase [Dactylosporangium sp. AC04546]
MFSNDFALEGEPEHEFHPGIARRMAHKTVASGALIRDPDGRILFVVPNYKPYLDLPGGIVETGEAPSAGCRREVREEVGLDLPIDRLLVVDWTPGRGPWSDQVQFVFDGGIVPVDTPLRPQESELTGVRWAHLSEADLRPSLRRRLELALRAIESDRTLHAEFGHLINGA